jgi:hypothetical protein
MALSNRFEKAGNKAREMQAELPRAKSVRYDRRIGRVVIHLSSDVEVAFPPRVVEGLENATPAQLSEIEISPSGFGLHFPAIDADVYVPALLVGVLGSRNWMASRLGFSGGKSTSTAKAAAARKNGQRGGRPRKRPVAA